MKTAKAFTSTGTLLWTEEYRYDAAGRNIHTIHTEAGQSPTEKFSIYDGFDMYSLIMEMDGDERITMNAMHAPAVDLVLAEDRLIYDSLGNVTDHDVTWPLGDHQNSPVAVATTPTGTNNPPVVTDQTIRSAFGSVIAGASPESSFGFQGHVNDTATGQSEFRNRNFSAQQGRFISQDPIRFASGQTNHYQFVGNHPHMATDPSGLKGEGQHRIPWDFIKNLPPDLLNFFDSDAARIDNEYYNFHGNGIYNGITHPAYNEAVAVEIRIAESKLGPMNKWDRAKAQGFLDHIKDPAGKGKQFSAPWIVHRFNDAVQQEADLAESVARARINELQQKYGNSYDKAKGTRDAKTLGEDAGKKLRLRLTMQADRAGLSVKISNKAWMLGGRASKLLPAVPAIVMLVNGASVQASANELGLSITNLDMPRDIALMAGAAYEYQKSESARLTQGQVRSHYGPRTFSSASRNQAEINRHKHDNPDEGLRSVEDSIKSFSSYFSLFAWWHWARD